jgi:hypothetical protein
MSVLEGLTLDERRAVWSQASMEARGQIPSEELLKEIVEALHLQKEQQQEEREAQEVEVEVEEEPQEEEEPPAKKRRKR